MSPIPAGKGRRAWHSGWHAAYYATRIFPESFIFGCLWIPFKFKEKTKGALPFYFLLFLFSLFSVICAEYPILICIQQLHSLG